MKENKPKVLIYMPFYSGVCESRHARMHDVIQYLNTTEAPGFSYQVIAERGKSRDSDRVWFNEIPFLKRYTESYRFVNKAKVSSKETGGDETDAKGDILTGELVNDSEPVYIKLYVTLLSIIKIITSLFRGDAHAPVFRLCRERLFFECSKMPPCDILHIVRPNKVSDRLIKIFKQKNPNLKIIIGPNLMAYGAPSNAFTFDQFSDSAITKVIAVSTYHKKLLEEFGFERKKLFRLPPSVHPKYFNPSVLTPRKDNIYTIFFAASQLSVEKGAEEFLLALRDVKQNAMFEFRAIVAGNFEVQASVQTSLDKELINTVSSYVEFVGSVKRDEMAMYYSQADVFVHCGEPENGPTTIIEALSCGVTCLLPNHLCFKEPELEASCYFYNRGDIDELVNSLLQMQKKHEGKSIKGFLPQCTHDQTIEFLSSVYENV